MSSMHFNLAGPSIRLCDRSQTGLFCQLAQVLGALSVQGLSENPEAFTTRVKAPLRILAHRPEPGLFSQLRSRRKAYCTRWNERGVHVDTAVNSATRPL